MIFDTLVGHNLWGASMRSFVIAIAILGMFATAVQADDAASTIVGKFPDTSNHLHVYLFVLKESNISLSMDPQDFCNTMGYGNAVLGERPKQVGKDDKPTPGKLEWVICRFGD